VSQLFIDDSLIEAVSLVASPLAPVSCAEMNSSQSANCSDHECAACDLPSAFRTLHRGFYKPP
jgi:hypothetical protein